MEMNNKTEKSERINEIKLEKIFELSYNMNQGL